MSVSKQIELRDLEIIDNPENYYSFYLETPAEYVERMLAKIVLNTSDLFVNERVE